MKVEERRKLRRRYKYLKPIYERMKRRNRGNINISLLELTKLTQYIEQKGYNIDMIDIEAIIDAKLSYYENKELIDKTLIGGMAYGFNTNKS